MAKSKLEIFVTAATDKAVAAMNKLNKATGDVGDETDDTGKKMGFLDGVMLSLGGMATNMAISFAKSIPEMVELGIEAERAEVALIAYAGSSEEAAKFTDAVRDAAGGAISELDAMQNASRLLAMGLATNTDEAAKLTEIAVTLGASMGKGPKQAFEEFTLMLANQSIPRLDTFGISAGKVRERMAALADENAGMDRQTRFLIATMEDAEGKLIQLAEAGFDATSSVDQLKAASMDAKVEMAKMLSEGIEPTLVKLLEMRQATLDEKQAILEGAESFDEYYKALDRVESGLMGAGGASEELARATWEVYQASLDTSNAAYDLHEQYRLGKVIFEEAEVAIRNYAGELDTLSEIVNNKVGQAYDRFIEKQEDLNESISDIEGEIKELENAQYITPAQLSEIKEGEEKIIFWGGWVETLEGRIDTLNKKPYLTDIQKSELAQMKLDLETATGNVETAEESIEGLNELMMVTVDQKGQVVDLNEKLVEQQEKVVELEEAYEKQTKKMIFNMLAQKLAASDMAEDVQLQILTKVATAYDLMDDKQVAATTGIMQAMANLSAEGGPTDAFYQMIFGIGRELETYPKNIDIIANVSVVGADLAAITGGYGFQHGGSFLVGGQGVDQTPVAFMATRGERVTITPPGAKGGGGRPINIYFSGPVYGDQYELERTILPIVEKGIRADKARQ